MGRPFSPESVMRNAMLLSLFVASSSAPAVANAGPPVESVELLVLKEHGVGTAAQAQQYVDRLVQAAAEVNGWKSASGRYFTQRSQAKAWIDAQSPEFGILSLAALLALRKDQKLDVLATATVKGEGGRQYHVVSKDAQALAECKGKTLATNHADDAEFIDKVVGHGSFKLSDFQVSKTRRPLQTVKDVIRGEAHCALIDDAQHEDLANIEGGNALRTVWSSKTLPPMAVVAFPSATPAVTKKFRQTLPGLCQGKGKPVCEDAGIIEFKSAGAAVYKAVIAQYEG